MKSDVSIVFFQRAVLVLLLALAKAALPAQTIGCTDTQALNFEPASTRNDGSCRYPRTTLDPVRQTRLPTRVNETSGLTFSQDGQLFTLNDSDDTRLYTLDTLTGDTLTSRLLTRDSSVDWEALALHGDTLYVGDFGNNVSGNRRDLRILRFFLGDDAGVLPKGDTIHFAYADQLDFEPVANNTTDFDCEAFYVAADSIYLFTKVWTAETTTRYVLANRPGHHLAQPRGKLDVEGLITDACYRPNDNLLILSGYSRFLEPFLYLFYDFPGREVFSGNRRRVGLDLPAHQVEGVATFNGLDYFISNERFERFGIRVPATLSVVNLRPLLGEYLHPTTSQVGRLSPKPRLRVWPNPTQGEIFITLPPHSVYLELLDLGGRPLERWHNPPAQLELSLRYRAAGVYELRTNDGLGTRLLKL